ncbi:hypothetical protein I3842_08G090000 [Carya illinoinensis]|uniref:Uncharacterized protein n=1 Tax=Carya illinoinensis TaxID=32201 RepID=A0A922EBG7_CARIL|nr:hypothetical protein I3842_08G090000 [Carya illinoinensis]
MANYTLFSFKPFDFDGFQGNYGSFEDLEKEETLFKEKQDHPLELNYGHHHHHQQTAHSNNLALDEYHFNHVFPLAPQILENLGILDHDKKIPHLPLLHFLRNDGSGTLRNINAETCGVSRKLSTEEIVRVVGARYVQLSTTQMHDDYHCMPMHPFAPSDLSEDEKRDVELVQLLLSKAEKVGYQQHDRARRLLLHCKWISSARCNSVQRVVFHFALALRERIAKESGRSVKTAKGEFKQNDEIDEDESVASERKVYLIDIGIKSGVQWTLLMLDLADIKDFPIELLKIMTVGSTRNERIEETGKRLGSVTESMNLPFSFKSIILSDVKDIKEDFFEIEDDEIMIIFASLALRTMISRPSWLENFMRVITNLNPSIMIVFEVEANHNSPSFVNRFIESLFFCCAYFDSLETCMEKHEEERMKMETIMGGHIRNLVAEEGRGRKNRSVTIDVWRAFFARFRMLEIGLSQSSLNQASLVAERFSCRNYCTLDKNGKCLIVGWKGTPLHSLSVWNFMS